MIFVYITCQSKKEAEKIGQALVKEKLAGCINYWPIESIYYWNGKLVKDKEFVLIIKTLKKNFNKIEKRVKALHSYQAPCVCAIPISKVNQKYFNWLKNAASCE